MSDAPDSPGPVSADHALAELRSWMGLAASADTSNQQLRWQLASALRKVRAAPASQGAIRSAVLEADHAWYLAAKAKSLQYRRNPSAGTADPTRFHAEMAEIEHLFGEVYERLGYAPEAGQDTLQDCTAHALFHYGKHLKWLICNREQPAAGTWQRLHRLLAESIHKKFSAQPAALFGGDSAAASCGQLWLRAVMLATLNSGHFSPRQIDRAEEWLEDWCQRIGADPAYDESKHHYCVDVAGDAGPVRASPTLQMARPLFLRAPHLYRDITQVRPKFLEKSMTSSLGLHAMNPLKEYLDLLDHLQRMWTPAPSQAPQRASERTEVPQGTTVEVVLGFKAVRALFDPDIADAVIRSPWTVREQSQGGMGMVSPMRGDAAPVSQQLIALRYPNEAAWQLGVVVRVMPIPSLNESRVGVRLLARRAVIVTLAEINDPAASQRHPARTHRVFFISGNDRVGQADSMLCAAGAVAPGMGLLLNTPQNSFLLQANRVVEGAMDWQRVGFQVLEKLPPQRAA